jgi:hypothetical protein
MHSDPRVYPRLLVDEAVDLVAATAVAFPNVDKCVDEPTSCGASRNLTLTVSSMWCTGVPQCVLGDDSSTAHGRHVELSLSSRGRAGSFPLGVLGHHHHHPPLLPPALHLAEDIRTLTTSSSLSWRGPSVLRECRDPPRWQTRLGAPLSYTRCVTAPQTAFRPSRTLRSSPHLQEKHESYSIDPRYVSR